MGRIDWEAVQDVLLHTISHRFQINVNPTQTQVCDDQSHPVLLSPPLSLPLPSPLRPAGHRFIPEAEYSQRGRRGGGRPHVVNVRNLPFLVISRRRRAAAAPPPPVVALRAGDRESGFGVVFIILSPKRTHFSCTI